jgi:hypothetical protein
MKVNSLLTLLSLFFFLGIRAQADKNSPKTNTPPENFIISSAELKTILNLEVNSVLNDPSNKYINKAALLVSTKNGDMQFARLKLSYFPKAFLMVQVNGVYSTQVFILSDDASVSYKGKETKDGILLTHCKQDEIVSE